MKAMTTIICANCGERKNIDRSEYNYQISRGRKNFFCSRTCSAKFNNAKNRKWLKRTQVCKHCGKLFETESHYDVTFCSRECASSGSITEYRRKRMSEGGKIGQIRNPGTPSATCNILKSRESWKYAEIDKYLKSKSANYEFEYLVDKYIFDLALFDYKTFIEFDSDYHKSSDQQIIDLDKEQTASRIGWEVIHISTGSNTVLDISLLANLEIFNGLKEV